MSYSYAYKSRNEKQPRLKNPLQSLDGAFISSTGAALLYLVVLGAGSYYLLRQSNVLPPNAIKRFLWRCFVYAIPPSLVLALEKRKHTEGNSMEVEETYADSRTYGTKSEAVRKILGLDSSNYLDGFRSPGSLLDRKGVVTRAKGEALPGLFNRDNECYQNSIIQGLAALPSFSDFVDKLPSPQLSLRGFGLRDSLQDILRHLNDPDQYGKAFWTPRALKSMSSWQQQDAQEYFSKVIDGLEKDAMKALKSMSSDTQPAGLGCLRLPAQEEKSLFLPNAVVNGDASLNLQSKLGISSSRLRKEPCLYLQNPLEGLQAQRVGCMKCGFVEGLSLIPFNCITVSLGKARYTDIESCLNTYTELETIPGVECARCTLLRQEGLMAQALEAPPGNEDDANIRAYFEVARSRLQAVKTALEDHDFSESTLAKKCKIPAKSRVLTDKTRQAVIARPPRALTIHINRSVFDETTGAQFKNFAGVQFPKVLNLDPWCLGSQATGDADEIEKWETDPSKSMLKETSADIYSDDGSDPDSGSAIHASRKLYTLRAVITHYGTHGDGHYIAWRQSSEAIAETDSRVWWRLSDEEVVRVDEDIVLSQGGVFMLFYERIEGSQHPELATPSESSATEREATMTPTSSSIDDFIESSGELSDLEREHTHEEKDRLQPSTVDGANDEGVKARPEPRHDQQPRQDAPKIRGTRSNPSTEAFQPKNVLPSTQMRTAGEVSQVEGVDKGGMRGIVPAV